MVTLLFMVVSACCVLPAFAEKESRGYNESHRQKPFVHGKPSSRDVPAVYNLEIATSHGYLTGRSNLLTHNVSGIPTKFEKNTRVHTQDGTGRVISDEGEEDRRVVTVHIDNEPKPRRYRSRDLPRFKNFSAPEPVQALTKGGMPDPSVSRTIELIRNRFSRISPEAATMAKTNCYDCATQSVILWDRIFNSGIENANDSDLKAQPKEGRFSGRKYDIGTGMSQLLEVYEFLSKIKMGRPLESQPIDSSGLAKFFRVVSDGTHGMIHYAFNDGDDFSGGHVLNVAKFEGQTWTVDAQQSPPAVLLLSTWWNQMLSEIDAGEVSLPGYIPIRTEYDGDTILGALDYDSFFALVKGKKGNHRLQLNLDGEDFKQAEAELNASMEEDQVEEVINLLSSAMGHILAKPALRTKVLRFLNTHAKSKDKISFPRATGARGKLVK